MSPMLTKSFQQLSCLYHKRRLLECFSLQVTSARMLNNNPETILKIHLQLSLANDCKYSTYDTYSLISGTMYCWYKDIIITSQQKSLQFLLKPFIPQATMKNCKDYFISASTKKSAMKDKSRQPEARGTDHRNSIYMQLPQEPGSIQL